MQGIFIFHPPTLWASSASARSVLLLCSDYFGAPRGARIGKHDREVGILLGIEIEGASICPEISGKPLAMILPLDGRAARICEYVCSGLYREGIKRLRRATTLSLASEVSMQRRNS